MEHHKPRLYKTMTEIATLEIQDAILNGIFKPGSKIVPAQLEKNFNLGRAAIRDAIRELSGKGLLINLPNKGTVVAGPISKEEIIEVFEIRFLLEGKAAFRAAQTISPEGIHELEVINDTLKEVPRSDSKEFFAINKQFHLSLYKHSKWSFLCKTIDQLWDQTQIFRIVYPFEAEAIGVYIDDHKKILSALINNNPEKVRDELVSHVKKGFVNIMQRHTP